MQTRKWTVDHLTNRELLSRAAKLVRTERKITLEILNAINAVYARRAYAEAGYSSCYTWLTKGLGYSESAASRRLRSAEMLRTVPAIAKKIEDGAINLSTLAQTQSAIRNEEKRTGETFSTSERGEIVQKIEACTQRETEVKLAAIFPEALPRQELVLPVDESHAKMQTVVSLELSQKIERLKEVLSHSKPGATIAEIVEASVDALLKQKDPLVREIKPRKVSDETLVSQPILASAPLSGDRKASGNEDTAVAKADCVRRHSAVVKPSCRTHNRLAAEKVFGAEHMRQFV